MRKSSRIQGVIFDRDNTLLYFDRLKVAKYLFKLFSAAPLLNWPKLIRYWRQEMGIELLPKDPQSVASFFDKFWVETIAPQFSLRPATAQKLSKLTQAYTGVLVPFPDTVQTLQLLHSQNYKLAVLTNFELPDVESTFTATKIDPALFIPDGLISSSMIGVAKPEPAAFQYLLDKLQLPASAVAFVDDLLENVVAASKLGMLGVLIDHKHKYRHKLPSNILRISSISQLLEVLAADSESK